MKKEDLYESCSSPQEHADVLYRKLSELSHVGTKEGMDERLQALLLESFQNAENETINAMGFVIERWADELHGTGLFHNGEADAQRIIDEFVAEMRATVSELRAEMVLEQIKKVGFFVKETEHGPGMEVRGTNEIQAAAERDLGPTTRERLEALEDFAQRVAHWAEACRTDNGIKLDPERELTLALRDVVEWGEKK